MKDCTGPGTCGPALRCADTQVGKSCLPGCNTDANCPVGQFCNMGECYTPMEGDGGCSALQCRPDAGKPIVITPKDAGTGNGGSGGCGCANETVRALGTVTQDRRACHRFANTRISSKRTVLE